MKKNKNHALFIKNNSGVLLIEIIISVGIVGILMLSLLSMMQLVNQNSSRVSLGVTKNELINRIRFSALSLPSIESSAKLTMSLGEEGLTPNVGAPNSLVDNKALADCLPTVGTSGTCDKSAMTDARGFKFYLAGGATEDTSKIVAGEDVYYTFTGIKCDQTRAAFPAECPIMATSWAEPFCSNFATSCNKALSLTIRYRVALRPDFTGNLLMSPIEGEIYLPLTKGIQLSRLLSQNDYPITMNGSGIYTVQKYYGYPDQASQATGLRFEAILGNPTGLASMKLQYRFVTGTDANSYLDNSIPGSLAAKEWIDVEDPTLVGIPWTVDLTGAKANQIINFGTQAAAGSSAIVSKDFRIGATSADTAAIQSKYLWTFDETDSLVQPEFKSGFYQFRILATDLTAGTIESMNYMTIRILPRPQVITPASQPALLQNRNCIDEKKEITYQIAVTDDEGLGAQKITLNSSDISFSAVSGTNGIISIPFDLSQEITSTNQIFSFAYSIKNKFSEYPGVSATTGNLNITLSEDSVNFEELTSSPSKIRISTTGTVNATFTTGTCCNQIPTVNWSYPAVPEVAAALLSGPTSSVATCSIDTTTDRRICSTNVSVTGLVESPSTTSSPDISSVVTFATSGDACTGGTPQTVYNNNAYIPVVKIPGIQFFLTESLWLTIPNNPINSLKSISPRVYVRADFQPDEDVTVGVYRSSDNFEVCTITFEGGTGLNTIDKSCPLPAGYSGDLALKKVSANIMIDTDIYNPSFRAKLTSGKLNHRTCQPNLSDHPQFSNHTLTGNQPMLNSPWGLTLDGFGNAVQDSKNDAGNWTIGSTKAFRCYDTWNGRVGVYPKHFDFNNDPQNISMLGLGTQDINVQDAYNITRYNNERGIIRPTTADKVHLNLGTINTGRYRFQTYIYPDNPALDFNPKNAPWLFTVWNHGSPGNAVWQYINPAGGIFSAPAKPWTDIGKDLCTGSAQLSTIKLLAVRGTGQSTAETVMKANNNVYSTPGSGYYTYAFMCSYGRWNPNNKLNTNWTH